MDRSAIAQREGDPERAELLATEALNLAQTAQDPSAIARAEDLLGIIARGRHDLPLARQHLERAIAAADLAESASSIDPRARSSLQPTRASGSLPSTPSPWSTPMAEIGPGRSS